MSARRGWLSGGAALAVAAALAVTGCGSSSGSSTGKTGTKAAAGSGATTATTGGTTATSATTGTTGGSTSGGGTTAGANAAVAKLVPASIKSKGTITVAADASYAPDEFFASDGKTVIGMDADLSHALAKVMGLKANVVNQTFASIIPGLAAGKYDMGASSFTDTKAREKTVTFVDYFTAGMSFFTKASGGTSVTGLSDLCGKSVAVEQGTTELTAAQAQSKKCTAAGKKAVSVSAFTDQSGANLALSSGRVQLGFADSPVAAYAVKKSNGQFKLVGPTFASAPYGLALPKGSKLVPAVEAALKVLMKDGTYTTILKKWGLQGGAITASQVKINGATS
jgi:polar amino acid transport system substrate-binding protein